MTTPGPSGPISQPAPRAGRPLLEVVLLLGVSLGESAIYSVLRIVERLTRPQPLSAQKSSLNTAVTPDRAWLEVINQLVNVTLPLVPVLLALYLVSMLPGASAWPGDDVRRPAARRIGLGAGSSRRWLAGDLVRGTAVAAAIGVPGLAFYLFAREIGINTTVQPANLGEHWWTVPIYLLSAAMNGLLEEVVVIGYLFLRLSQWRQQRAEALGRTSEGGRARLLGVEGGRFWWPIICASAVLRGSYHLYQGFGGFLGNLVMGLVFGWLFLRWKRILPLVIAHTLLDIAAFCGYALLAGRVSWL